VAGAKTFHLAVIGPGEASPEQTTAAETVGRLAVDRGAMVVTGGLGGVMAAASRGAFGAGGVVVGLLPGLDRTVANPWVTVPLATGLGELRNGLVVRAADVVVAIGGGAGTLSEIALALKAGKPVVGIDTWDIPGVEAVATAHDAVALALPKP
jgi:uncharacterized protein (TIGR00725 family)